MGKTGSLGTWSRVIVPKWFSHLGIILAKGQLATIQYPPVDLHFIFEKSSFKKQFRRTGFLACKNPFQNFKFRRTWFFQIEFSEIKYRATGSLTLLQGPKDPVLPTLTVISKLNSKNNFMPKLFIKMLFFLQKIAKNRFTVLYL